MVRFQTRISNDIELVRPLTRIQLDRPQLDKKILKVLHDLMRKSDRRMWIVVTLVVFLLLHIREQLMQEGIFLGVVMAIRSVLLQNIRSDIILIIKASTLDTLVEVKGTN